LLEVDELLDTIARELSTGSACGGDGAGSWRKIPKSSLYDDPTIHCRSHQWPAPGVLILRLKNALHNFVVVTHDLIWPGALRTRWCFLRMQSPFWHLAEFETP